MLQAIRPEEMILLQRPSYQQRKFRQVLCMIQFFVNNPNETNTIKQQYTPPNIHLTAARALERSTTWLFYPLVVSSSLLLAYLVALTVKWGYSRSKLVQGWMRRLTGKLSKEEKMLLHTLPYYLAISRSSCEVNWLLFPLPQHLVFRYMF